MTVVTLKEKVLEKQLRNQPKEVKFCKRCVISNQRPRIVFDEEGVCGACRYADEKKNEINWKTRELQLQELCDKYRRNDGRWDVVVPGSGGKDSAYVAHQLKHHYGMHPLTVTWAPAIYTDIGYQNFQNFIGSGFGNLLGTPNGRLERKLTRIAFEEVGDPFLTFIYGQMCFPFHVALRFDIKLVFYGENGEAEYGGDPKYKDKSHMPMEDWAMAYWKGTTIDRLIDYGLRSKSYFTKEDFDESDLIFYHPPSFEDLRKAGVQKYWYSYFHNWDSFQNYLYCEKYTGFQLNPERSEATYTRFHSLDDQTDGFHFYMGFIKFGIARATADACRDIRAGRITRERGVELVRKYDGEFPSKYFKDFLKFLDMAEDELRKTVDSFRQPHLWEKINGEWKLKYQVS